MRLIRHEGLTEAFLLTWGELVARGAQKKPDLVEGITCASAVTQGVLLDATTYLIKGVTGELDDVKGIEHAGCVLELIVDGVLISLEGIQRRDLHPRSEVFSALGQPVLVHGARPSRDQVQQAGRGMILPACQVHDAGELTWASSASVLVMPHMLINPQYPHACEAGGVIRCGLQARLDVGPHGILRSCQLSSQSCNGGSLEAQLSDRPADRPGAQTRPGSTHRVVLLSEGRDLAGVFAAYPASLKPPDPRRDPGPGRVDHLHHHAPVALSDSAHTQGSQQGNHRTLCRAPEPVRCEPRSSDGSPPNRRADHTDHNDQATQNSSR